ncbi:hypothetical protein [Methylobacterium nonmethylotrophicum]|uniref:hypothetical protein n=1 Tax=Methylobacterium nonmethylotrophicum TaxID=1141884 RepID=UPI00197B1CBF|nr:hypothetical protein [Methylobacterium nonmethylotrophicum]
MVAEPEVGIGLTWATRPRRTAARIHAAGLHRVGLFGTAFTMERDVDDRAEGRLIIDREPGRGGVASSMR